MSLFVDAVSIEHSLEVKKKTAKSPKDLLWIICRFFVENFKKKTSQSTSRKLEEIDFKDMFKKLDLINKSFVICQACITFEYYHKADKYLKSWRK